MRRRGTRRRDLDWPCTLLWMRRTFFAIPLIALVIGSVTTANARIDSLSPSRVVDARPPSTRATAPPDFSHVVIIVMENKEYSQVIGSSQAPYINGLAAKYALATRFYGVSHPSLPNYLALTAGSTFGRTSDCTSCLVDATNIVDQLANHGITWKAYMQGMPSACYKGPYYGLYAKKHNPFVYYKDVLNNPSWCANDVPYAQLLTDLTNHTLPQFAFITPNLCNDMHDCSVKTGDNFLSHLVPKILPELGSTGVLFLTWDEGATSYGCCTYAHGGHIPTVLAGPAVRSGVKPPGSYDLYSILKTVELGWGFQLMRGARCACTAPMNRFFK
jgi:phospholipase C